MTLSRPTIVISLAAHVLLLGLLYFFSQPADLPEPPKSMQAVLMSMPSESGSTSTATVEPKSEPAPTPKPEPKPVIKPESKPKPEPKSEPKPKPEPKPEAKAEPVKPKPTPPVEPKPEAKKPDPVKKPVKPKFDDSQLNQEENELEADIKRSTAADAKRKRLAALAAASAAVDAKAAADEQSRLQAAQIAEYTGLINKKIKASWRHPPAEISSKLVVGLRITLLPGGEVASVVIITSSGNTAFDGSVLDAVKRSSPLPVPTDSALFRDNFKVVQLNYKSTD